MLLRALLVILCCASSPFLFAQELKNFDFYYSHPQVSQEAKEYYAGLFSVNNNEKAYSVMDSVFTQNDATRPFYIYLVCKMLDEADENMMADLSIICRYVVEIHPTALMAVLHAGRNYVDDKYRAIWAKRISTELRVTCDQELMDCFKISRNAAIQACAENQKQRLETLYNMVRKDLNLFQQG